MEPNERKGYDYQVSLICRWEDTGKGFTDHLYTSLVDAKIRVLINNIGSSFDHHKIFIPIISKNYTSNTTCLHELAQMLNCKRREGRKILPIFYRVERSKMLQQLTEKLSDPSVINENLSEMAGKEWEEMLKELSSLEGWESEKQKNGHEGAFVKFVVEEVKKELARTSQQFGPEVLIGVHDCVEEIMSFINAESNDTKIVGIYGIRGVGKTALARYLYKNLSSPFEHRSCMANIRETSLTKGIEYLQKQLIYNILKSRYDVSEVNEGIDIIKSQFTSKKALILLDDISDNTQLDALAGDVSWFKAGSIVIITTRCKSILDTVRNCYRYEHRVLPLNESLVLFSRHAFGKNSPPDDYVYMCRKVVPRLCGLPLTLKVIGSFLHEKSREVWRDAIEKLREGAYFTVQDILKISFEQLEYKEKQIFLDIACLFVGSFEQSPTYMWDVCNFHSREGIEKLRLKSLIKIEDGKPMMSDTLGDFGREYVCLENQTEPQKRSRLWNHKEAADVLDNNKATRKIEALCLGKYGRGRKYTAEQFKELTNLRFLQMEGANFTGDFQNLLPQLRWLQWQDCPWDFEATNFHPEKLVVLDLSRSRISEGWKGWDQLKMATELKVLNLTGCLSLKSTPDLSAFKSLEVLILEDSENLERIDPSIGFLVSLTQLELSCSCIEELPKSMSSLTSLTQLDLYQTGIREFPESMGSLVSLTQLNLSQTGIEELPKCIGNLKNLQTLDASWCGLASIPTSIGDLKSLSLLDLRECNKLAQLPDSIGSLESLQRLLLRGCCSLSSLPNFMGQLASLTELDLNSTAIQYFPRSIENLQKLSILDIRGTPIRDGDVPGQFLPFVKKDS